MLYVLITYCFAPFLLLATAFKRRPTPRRLLVIQTAKIGDMVCSTPIFREVKRAFPQLHLTVLTQAMNQELLKNNPHIDQVELISPQERKGLLAKAKLCARLYHGRYDVVICLNPNVTFAVCTFWALIGMRLSVRPNFMGSSYRLASYFWSACAQHRADRLIMQTYLDLLRRLGIDAVDLAKEVYENTDAPKVVDALLPPLGAPLIGIAVSSGNKLKALSVEQIASLCSRLLESTSAHLILIGAAEDHPDAQKLRGLVSVPERIVDTTGKLTLAQIPALLKRLALFIGVDSGLTHMADALRIRLVTVAGPGNMQETRPAQPKSIVIQKILPCAPCTHIYKTPYHCKIGTRECITSVRTDEILRAARSLLDESNEAERINDYP